MPDFAETPGEVVSAFDLDFTDEDAFSDIVITVVDGGVSCDFHAHRFVLAQRSQGFRSMLATSPQGNGWAESP